MSNLFGGTPLPGRFDKVEKADLTGVTQVASTINVRDKEMRRRFERAENMRRDDINEAAGYDLASIGQFGSEIFQQEVDEVTQLIASGQLNPTEARAKLGELKGLYNQFNTHAEAMSTEDAVANKLATDPEARAARNKAMGIGEELSYGVDDYATQHNLALNNVFKPGSAQKGPDGKWTVIEPTTGERVPFSQVKGFADPSFFYKYGSKAVDVGTLGDWAQDKSTASAISFKDGKWNEARSRDFYRDNVLTEDDNGKTHRLQLLGTLEDRGLIDHLTDEQKRNFRDGVDLGSESFQDIIRKGEDEFVARSQFDGTYGTKGKGSGSGSGSGDDKKDFVVGGLNVTPESTGGLLADLEIRSQGSHNLNRFNKPPVLEGAFEVPGKPNTENIQIVGAGVNSKGEQVAYIRGKQRVEVEGAIPGIEGDSDLVPYFKEIPIGGSAAGVGSDVMREIQQNHPEMYQQILKDQDKYEEDKLRGRGVRTSSAQTGGPATPDTGDAADRGEAALGARDAAVDEMKDLLRQRKEQEEQYNTPNPRTGTVEKIDARLAELRGGEFGDYLSNVFPEGGGGETPDELRPFDNSVETQEEQTERVRSEARQNVADTFFDNPIGRLFGYQGPEARAQAAADEARRSTRTTSKPIQVPQDQVADLRETLSPTMQNRLDRALDEAVRRGADGVGARRNENGDIVVTDRRGVPVPGLTPIAGVDIPEARAAGEVPNPALERSPVARTAPSEPGQSRPRASELAMNLVGEGAGSQDGGIGSYEGYSPDLQINVPAGSMNSGVTIAGLDIGAGAEGADEKLEILKDYLRPEDYRDLEKLKGLKGEAAQQALAKLQSEGKLLEDGLGLTQEDLNEITARQTEKQLPKIYKVIPEKKFAELPTEVQRAVAGVHFNAPGPKTLAAVNKAAKTKNPEDWREVANKYMTYWSGLSSSLKPEFKKWAEENNRPDLIEQMNSGNRSKEFGDAVIEYKLDVGRILPGNLKRVEDAALAITKAYNLEPLPSYAERTSGRPGSEDVAVN
jgi:hypothetical protein